MAGRISKEEVLEKLLTKARRDEDVLAVFLFGSAVREEQTDLSDIDLCLVLAPKLPPLNLQHYLVSDWTILRTLPSMYRSSSNFPSTFGEGY
jgi:predicted nucleotidyltransferase